MKTPLLATNFCAGTRKLRLFASAQMSAQMSAQGSARHRMRAPLLLFVLVVCASLFHTGANAAGAYGPGSGGGGDYSADERATDQDVRQAIQQAQALAPFVLAHLESVTVEARAVGSASIFASRPNGVLSLKKSTFDLLFPWPRKQDDAFVVLKRLEIQISDQECKDGLEQDKAASAYPYDSNSVCMSLPMIRVNATKANLLRRVTGLLIHELSHKMGIGVLAETHADSVALEQVVDDGIPADPYTFIKTRVVALVAAARVPGGEISQDISEVLKSLDAGNDWSKICFALGRISLRGAALGQNHNQTDGYEMVIVRASLQAEEEVIQKRSSLLPVYCGLQAAILNAGSDAINLGGDAVLSMTAGRLRKASYHDRVNLTLELNDIDSSLRKISVGATQAESAIEAAKP